MLITKETLKDIVQEFQEDILYPFDGVYGLVGFDALCALSEEFGGSALYIPSMKGLFRGCIAKQIEKEYNGINKKQLCKTYGLSESTVRTIIGK